MNGTSDAGGAGRPNPAGERPVNAKPGCGQVLNLPAVRCYWCEKPTTRRERSATGLMVPWCAACARFYRIKVDEFARSMEELAPTGEPVSGANRSECQTVAVGDQSAAGRSHGWEWHRAHVRRFYGWLSPRFIKWSWRLWFAPASMVLGAVLGAVAGVILAAVLLVYCVAVLVGLVAWWIVRRPMWRATAFGIVAGLLLATLGDSRFVVYWAAVLAAGYGLSVLCATVAITIGTRRG